MWQERFRGILIIFVAGLVALVVVRYLTGHQQELVQGVVDLSPETVQEKILGAVSYLQKRAQGEEVTEVAIDPMKIVEEKAGELLDEVKKLPEEQIDQAKKRIFGPICEEIEGESENGEN
jgi:hypothetical protein